MDKIFNSLLLYIKYKSIKNVSFVSMLLLLVSMPGLCLWYNYHTFTRQIPQFKGRAYFPADHIMYAIDFLNPFNSILVQNENCIRDVDFFCLAIFTGLWNPTSFLS